MSLIIVREGHGEEEALPTLVEKMRDHLQLHQLPYIPRNGSWRKGLTSRAQVIGVCEQARFRGPQALLLTRDADLDKQMPHDDCPKHTAPEIARWVYEQQLPFPVAVVLFYKEYETLFIAGADAMGGQDAMDKRNRRITTVGDVVGHPSPEQPRDAKKWVRTNLFPGYKETLHQISLTRLLDLQEMDARGLSSYRRLSSALTFLNDNLGVAGAVYPAHAGVGGCSGNG